MSSEKYIGLDVHQATISVAVMDSQGKVVMESILETKASTILEFLAGLRGSLYVTFEEGTWAAWLYDLLKPHVTEVLVCNPRKIPLLKQGNKSDKIDARKLAERLRLHDLKPVYHGETGMRMLRELARSYLTVVKDFSRVMNRLKALYRSWANPCAGRDVYNRRHRRQWLETIPEAGTRRRAEQLYEQLDMLQHLRQPARRELLAQGRKHTITAKLRRIPALGPIRSVLAVALIQMDLQRTGARNPRQRGISLRPRASAAAQKTSDDSRLEQRLQPRSERSVQRRCYSGQRAARTIPRLLSALARQRHQADHGAPHPSTQDCSHYVDSVEEGRRLRYRQTELASRLSVAGKSPFHLR